LWASARYDLNLSDAEFFGMTLQQVMAMMDRFDRSSKAAYLRAGIVASIVANVHRGKSQRPFSPWDFVPGGSQQEPHQQTIEEQIEIFKSITQVVN
jgi:hypothetical protein